MPDIENTPLAGGGEDAGLSMDAAAAQLEALDQQSVAAENAGTEPNTQEGQSAEHPETPETVQPGENGEAVPPETVAAVEGADTPDEDSVEFEKLHGNTKVILRDGTVLRVGELKQRIEKLQALDRHEQDVVSARDQLRQRMEQFAHQARQFSEVAPQAIAAIQAQIPPVPELPVYNPEDPVGYIKDKADYDKAVADRQAKIGQIQQIQHVQAMQAQEAQRTHQASVRQFLEQGQQQLFREYPELRTPEGARKFQTEVFEYGQKAGFTTDEINGVGDPRIVRVLRRAMEADRLEKLLTEKPKPIAQRTPSAAPVARPGPRASGDERQAQNREELRARVNKPGGLSMAEAASLLNSL